MPYEPDRPYGWVREPVPLRVRDDGPLKVCGICKVAKPRTSEFFYYKRAGTLDYRCKECHKRTSEERRKARGHKHSPDVVERKRLTRSRLRWHRNAEAGFPAAPRRYWNSQRAAAELGLLEDTLRKYVRQGKVPAVRHGRRLWRFCPETIRALARRYEDAQEAADQD